MFVFFWVADGKVGAGNVGDQRQDPRSSATNTQRHRSSSPSAVRVTALSSKCTGHCPKYRRVKSESVGLYPINKYI